MRSLFLMKLLWIMGLLLCFIQASAEVKEGIYISPNKQFSVNLPGYKGEIVVDERTETGRFVVNFTPNGDWKKQGRMSIEWYPVLDKSIMDDKTFYAQLDALIPNYIATNYPRSHFGQVYAQKMQVNGRAAYRFIAIGPLDNVYTYWSGTAVNYGNTTVIFTVLFPKVASESSMKEVPWQAYDAFINSFKVLQ